MKYVPDLSLASVFRMHPTPRGGIGPEAVAELDFGDGQFLRHGEPVALDSLLGHSRSTVATCVTESGLVASHAANVLRYDHLPITGAFRGILCEGAATNLLRYSADLTQTVWGATGVTKSHGHAAPDGSVEASLIKVNTAGGLHRVHQQWNPVLGQSYTQSVWLKSAGVRYVYVNIDANMNARITVDLQTGAYVVGGTAAQKPVVTPYPGGWYRVSITGTGTLAIGNSTYFQASSILAAGDNAFTGNGTDGFLVWGAQLETGPEPSSYIASLANSATRAADVAGLLGITATCDVELTYDDLSTETLSGQSVTPGWWPTLARPHLRKMVLR